MSNSVTLLLLLPVGLGSSVLSLGVLTSVFSAKLASLADLQTQLWEALAQDHAALQNKEDAGELKRVEGINEPGCSRRRGVLLRPARVVSRPLARPCVVGSPARQCPKGLRPRHLDLSR